MSDKVAFADNGIIDQSWRCQKDGFGSIKGGQIKKRQNNRCGF